MSDLQFDYIIVGAGSAGCVLAHRLSADPQIRVCLLEAGPEDRNPMIHMPVGMIWLMRSKVLNWQFNTEPEPGLDQRRCFWPRGRMLGGSSSSNAMCYIRGQAQDYDHWASLGNPGWGFSDVLPYFKRSEDQARGPDAYHGAGGPLSVMDPREPNELTAAFIEAGVQAGWPRTEDFNGARQEGVGYYQLTQRDGRRCSAAKGYLEPVRHRPNLTVLTGAQALKVLFEGRRATGVELLQGGRRVQARARLEVILSAGAIQSPQLLMLSGVGAAAVLQRQGLQPVHDLAGVGQNLQDHLDVMLVQNSRLAVSSGLTPKQLLLGLYNLYKFLAKGSGPLTANGAEGGGFVRSRPELALPDVQFHFMPARLRDHGRDIPFMMGEGYSIHACNLKPKSRGQITLKSTDPLQAPAMQPNYLSHPDDVRVMIDGFRIARRIFAAPAFDRYRGDEVIPGPGVQTDAQIEAFIRAKAETIYHPVGTCKMGVDADAVVDPRLRVHGLQGLRVVDASVMPTLVAGNTNAPTIMIAEKASDMIAEDRRAAA